MKKITNHWLFILGGILLAIFLIPYYWEGRIISGGEGAYFHDFLTFFRNYAYSWADRGTGTFAYSLNFAYVFHLLFSYWLFQDEKIVNFIMIFSIYFLPYLAIYLLSLELKLKSNIAVLISIFYIVNPFMSSFLKYINQWNTLAVYILPSFFLIILKFYNKRLALFSVFGLNSLLFAFTNANPPTMAIYQIAIILFVVLAAFYKEKSLNLLSILNNYLTVIFSFLLFNFWWITNLFYVFFDAQQGYTKEFAISWLRGSRKFLPTLLDTINLTAFIGRPINPQNDIFSALYTTPLAAIILTIPTLIMIIFFLSRRIDKKIYAVLGFLIVTLGFLAKGVDNVFGGIYEFLVMNAPLFYIFKSASEKWGILYIFSLTLLLILILHKTKGEKSGRIIKILLVIYITYCSIPFITSNFVPDYKHNEEIKGTRKYLTKKEYEDLKTTINKDKGLYRILSLPGSANYQVALQTMGGKFYTGNDPILNNINKPFIAPYSETVLGKFDVLFESISSPIYPELLGLYNIKKIVINKDSYPWFGFKEEEDIVEIENILENYFTGEKNNVLDLYDNTNYFLPKFYIPKNLIYSPYNDQKELPTIISAGNFSNRSAVFLDSSTQDAKADKVIPEDDIIKKNSSEIKMIGDIQSAVDEQKLRQGIRGLNPGGVLFPYARWKPGTIFYPYVQQKEENDKNESLNDSKKVIEKNLFYASKRIFEIQKWDREITDELFKDILEKYRQEMESAISYLETLNKEGEFDTFQQLLKIEVSFEAHRTRLLDVLKGDYIDEKNPRLEIAKSLIKNLDTKLADVVKRNYELTKYHFIVGEDEEYEILVEKAQTEDKDMIINIDSKNQRYYSRASLLTKQDNNDWLSFGKRLFPKGEYFISILKSSSRNLINNDWQTAVNKIEVGEKIKISGAKNSPLLLQELTNLKPKRTYQFSFKYKTNGESLKTIVEQEFSNIPQSFWREKDVEAFYKNKGTLLNKDLDSESEWKEFKTVITTDKYYKKLRFIISASYSSNNIIDFEFKEAKLIEILEPKMMLRKEILVNKMNTPQLSFKRINPTKYILDIKNAKNPYFLIFNEGFHRGWNVYLIKDQKLITKSQNNDITATYFSRDIVEKVEDKSMIDITLAETWGKTPLPENRHKVMNGYANSWYIEPQDVNNQANYQIIIEYWPQRLFYLGVFVSILTLIITLAFGIVNYLKGID